MTDLSERIAALEALDAARPSKQRLVKDLGKDIVDIDREFMWHTDEAMAIIRELVAENERLRKSRITITKRYISPGFSLGPELL